MRRRWLVGIALLFLLAGVAGATAYGTFLYRGADLRFDASLDPHGLGEVERVWRFTVPQGVHSVVIREHISNDGEASLAFGAEATSLSRTTYVTPTSWAWPPFGGEVADRVAASPGPFEVHVAAKAPARFVLGIDFVQ